MSKNYHAEVVTVRRRLVAQSGRKITLAVSLLFLLALLLPVASGLPAVQAQTAPASKVLKYLYNIKGSRTVSGQHNREPNAQPALWTNKIRDITGKFPGLWGGDFLFQQDNINNRWTMINEAKNQWRKGALVTLTWHACPPTGPEACDWDSNGVLKQLMSSEWNSIVTNGAPLNNVWKNRLDSIVPYLQDLQNNGVEVLFRPIHELTEGWSWWGGRSGANGSLKLFQITHDYLLSKGLTNLIWVWNVKDNDMGNIANFYPGDAYVDVLSIDPYVNGFSPTNYNTMVNLARGKPIAIGECDKLPSPGVLDSQPLWTYFMAWAELVTASNSNDQIKSTYYAGRTLNRERVDLANARNIWASSSENASYAPQFAVDYNWNTRWSSAYADNQYISVDLGTTRELNHVKLTWEAAYGKQYQVQLSNDNSSYWTVYSQWAGDGNEDDIGFTTTTARYVKLYLIQRGTQWGFSLRNFEVYAP